MIDEFVIVLFSYKMVWTEFNKWDIWNQLPINRQLYDNFKIKKRYLISYRNCSCIWVIKKQLLITNLKSK